MNRLSLFFISFSILFLTTLSAEEAEQKITEQPRYVYLSEKSPYVAVALSTLLGFGTGDFYAQNVPFGVVSAVCESVGIGLFVTSWIKIDDDNDNFMERSELKGDNFDTDEKIWFYTGLSTWISARIFGAISGGILAHRHNKTLEKRFRFESNQRDAEPNLCIRRDVLNHLQTNVCPSNKVANIRPLFFADKDTNFAGFSINF